MVALDKGGYHIWLRTIPMSHFLLNGGQDVSKAQVAALRERSGDLELFTLRLLVVSFPVDGLHSQYFHPGLLRDSSENWFGGKSIWKLFSHSFRQIPSCNIWSNAAGHPDWASCLEEKVEWESPVRVGLGRLGMLIISSFFSDLLGPAAGEEPELSYTYIYIYIYK